MFRHRPRPDRLEQTLTVGRLPSNFSRLLSRVMGRFAGTWLLSSCNWAVVGRGSRRLYRLELTWRSDMGQYARLIDLPDLKALGHSVKLYDDISRLDRLRLWLLTVESQVRQLVGRA